MCFRNRARFPACRAVVHSSWFTLVAGLDPQSFYMYSTEKDAEYWGPRRDHAALEFDSVLWVIGGEIGACVTCCAL